MRRYYYWYICTDVCCYCGGDVSFGRAVVGVAGDSEALVEGWWVAVDCRDSSAFP